MTDIASHFEIPRQRRHETYQRKPYFSIQPSFSSFSSSFCTVDLILGDIHAISLNRRLLNGLNLHDDRRLQSRINREAPAAGSPLIDGNPAQCLGSKQIASPCYRNYLFWLTCVFYGP